MCVSGIPNMSVCYCTSQYNAEIFREAAGSLQGPLQFPLYTCLFSSFITQTGDVSDHYPVEFELLGKIDVPDRLQRS